MISYLLQFIALQAVLFLAYVLLVRREKVFRFNRIFLLLLLTVPMLIPMIPSSIGADEIILDTHYLSEGSKFVDTGLIDNNKVTIASSSQIAYWTLSKVLFFLYLSGAAIMMVRFLSNLVLMIVRTRKYIRWNGQKIVAIHGLESPYSFWNHIFVNAEDWKNERMDPLVMEHESVHVREKHTLDILLVETLKVFLWFNPIVYMIASEIVINHEFIADRYVTERHETGNYLRSLVYVKTEGTTTNLGSYNSFKLIKTRINMINKKDSNRSTTLVRLGSVTMISLLALHFSCTHQLNVTNVQESDFVVVLDPGHGGEDKGTRGESGVEKEIVLNIAKQVPEYLENDEIKVVYTRQSDEFVSLQDRVDIANSNMADLLVSLHLNAKPGDPAQRGISTHFSLQSNSPDKSKAYADQISGELEFPGIGSGVFHNDFVVLKRPESPSVLVNMGYLTNPEDERQLSDLDYQRELARRIAVSIDKWYELGQTSVN